MVRGGRQGGGVRRASELESTGVNASSLDLGAAGLWKRLNHTVHQRLSLGLTCRSRVPCVQFAVRQATNTLRRIPLLFICLLEWSFKVKYSSKSKHFPEVPSGAKTKSQQHAEDFYDR
jgi:hypothetical protein